MLAVMIVKGSGAGLTFGFVFNLIIIIAITSLGVAGVGGGATNSAIIVLAAMGLDITLAGILISIEPLIDMARTALNVNGTIVTGLITGKTTNSIDMDVYNKSNI